MTTTPTPQRSTLSPEAAALVARVEALRARAVALGRTFGQLALPLEAQR